MAAATTADEWGLAELLESPFRGYAVIDADGCWLYRLSVNNSGYGAIWYRGERQGIHRASYRHFRGPIPRGLEIHHKCRKRRCFRPSCLEACTRQKNMDYVSDDVWPKPFPCGHERTPENVSRNGTSCTGRPSFRCSKCNRRGGRSRRGWKATVRGER